MDFKEILFPFIGTGWIPGTSGLAWTIRTRPTDAFSVKYDGVLL